MLSTIDLPSSRRNYAKKHALIYFVPGNPGFVEYYADFLKFLRSLLDSIEEDTAYHILGRNLLGFKDAEHEPFGPGRDPWDLNGQINGVYDSVAALRVEGDGPGAGRPYDSVMLMGHSVGTYISVEVFHRHMLDPSRAPHLHLRHGLLLFPTLTHIAMSPSGTRVGLMLRVPFLETNAHVLAKAILWPIPEPALRWITGRLMGFSPRCAAVTAEWLKSRDGVWEAIYLGRSEMRTITEERWEEELWEVTAAAADAPSLTSPATRTPKFFMFYGKEDHWVANHLRDAFIEKRKEHGERGGRTSIAVDEGDLPHAFCVREDSSLAIAQKVAAWVEEIDKGVAV